MQTVTTIGLDIAKSVFQVRGVNAGGQVVIRRQSPRVVVLPEAATLPGRYRGLCLVPPLVARAAGFRPHGTIDVAGLREALRQTAEERHG